MSNTINQAHDTEAVKDVASVESESTITQEEPKDGTGQDLNFSKLRAKIKQFEQREAERAKQQEIELKKELEAKEEFKTLYEKSRAEIRNLRTESLLTKALSDANPEFVDLLTEKAKSQIQYDEVGEPINLDEIVQELRFNKPSAFVKPEAKPAGQVGTSVTNVATPNHMTRERAEQLALDPNIPLTDEILSALK